MVNQSFSWSDHIDLVSSRASKGLRRIAWFLPRHVLCCFYKGYILPLMTYANTVWGSCARAEGDRLERLQNYAAHVILGRRRDASATAMRRELGWPTLATRRALAESRMVKQNALVHPQLCHSPVDATPPWHPAGPSQHHTQSPRYHCARPPHGPCGPDPPTSSGQQQHRPPVTHAHSVWCSDGEGLQLMVGAGSHTTNPT